MWANIHDDRRVGELIYHLIHRVKLDDWSPFDLPITETKRAIQTASERVDIAFWRAFLPRGEIEMDRDGKPLIFVGPKPTPEEGGGMLKRDVYKAFEHFANKRKSNPLSENMFWKSARALYGVLLQQGRPWAGNNQRMPARVTIGTLEQAQHAFEAEYPPLESA